MSYPHKRIYVLLDDPDLFLQFLSEYHEAKWEKHCWHDIDSYLEVSGGEFSVRAGAGSDYSSADIIKFVKYVSFQLAQYTLGKCEICLAFDTFKKQYGKKTSEVSSQTAVSLDQNKKYYGPKVL